MTDKTEWPEDLTEALLDAQVQGMMDGWGETVSGSREWMKQSVRALAESNIRAVLIHKPEGASLDAALILDGVFSSFYYLLEKGDLSNIDFPALEFDNSDQGNNQVPVEEEAPVA